MASVAICPHCYLQLIVPDGVERDALVECPTCAKEFDLGQAVLRDIPAVVRVERARVAESEAKQVAAAVEAQIETDAIQEIQARIEAEIAENGLHAGVRELSPRESTETYSERLAADTVRRPDTERSAWFRQRETVPDVPETAPMTADDGGSDADGDGDGGDDADEAKPEQTQAADEVVEVAEFIEVEIAEETAAIALEEVDAEQVDAEQADAEPEPAEVRPSAVTLADLLPQQRQPEESELESESLPGPSFDLPNVRLTPDNGATIEFESGMSFGPAAETEFELDGVDFESMPDEQVDAAEAAVYVEPGLQEPEPVVGPSEPFVLPKLPRTKKKRSVVRTLVGLATSSVVGLTLGYLALLYLRGPELDFLHVAQYMPSAILPNAFHSEPTQLAQATEPPAPSVEAAAEVEAVADEVESENVPASYVEESPAAPVPLSTIVADDDRYGGASSPSPSPLEEPAATPITTAAAPLPLRGPTYSIEQLQTALDAGEQAKSGLVTGDLSDAAVRRTKGMSYAKLCDLAQALVFLDRSSATDRNEELKQQANGLFGEILADARVRDEVNRIASIWIVSPHRRHGGVFLSGKLGGGQIAGDVYEYQLADAKGDTMVLLMQEPLDPLVDGTNLPLGIVGTIVDQPAEEIDGYRGTASRAIWVDSTIPLE
jgi:hypothetical protein